MLTKDRLFRPTVRVPTKQLLLARFDDFARRVRIRWQFRHIDTPCPTLYVPNPKYMPPPASGGLELLLQRVRATVVNQPLVSE